MRVEFPAWLPLVSGGRVAVGGDKLRHWGISETWRIRWADGATTIVKRGAGAVGGVVWTLRAVSSRR